MIKYILKRIGYMLVTLLIITTVTFFMMHSIPGDPLGAMANKLPEQARQTTTQNTVWINLSPSSMESL